MASAFSMYFLRLLPLPPDPGVCCAIMNGTGSSLVERGASLSTPVLVFTNNYFTFLKSALWSSGNNARQLPTLSLGLKSDSSGGAPNRLESWEAVTIPFVASGVFLLVVPQVSGEGVEGLKDRLFR